MVTTIHRLTLRLGFPAGLAPGEGSYGNELSLARDGRGRPVLRGTVVAGVLRALWRNYHGRSRDPDVIDSSPVVTDFFGTAAEADDSLMQSPFETHDCLIHVGDSGNTARRTHHLRCRHTGRVLDGGLFSLEACPPGSTAEVTLWFRQPDSMPEDRVREFLGTLVTLLRRGAVFGGKGNRGVGMANVEDASYGRYDASTLDGCAAYLDDHRAWREGKTWTGGSAELPEPADEAPTSLRVEFSLTIPRGQDLLIGEGQGLNAETEPQRVTAADGCDYWRLPGSTLHGLFRSWYLRLAARDGETLADSVDRFQRGEPRTGEWLGWLYEKDNRDTLTDVQIREKYPAESLFGSLYACGRVHIADAFAPVSDSRRSTLELARQANAEVQLRRHVALDAISGGAIEHMLFDNLVLTGPVQFPVTMLIQHPTEQESQRLAQTLRALDAGVLRIGSSKSAGRVVLSGPPRAEGPCADSFEQLQSASV